jgi:Flp pilus assembly protein TadG
MSKGKKTFRRGAAVVEMAVVLPLLLTLVLGIIQYGYVFMVRQSLTHAANEACRVATLPGSTDTDILSTVDSYLSGTGLSGYSVSISHYTQQDPTETVTVQIPYAEVSLVGDFFGAVEGKMLGFTSKQRKQGVD